MTKRKSNKAESHNKKGKTSMKQASRNQKKDRRWNPLVISAAVGAAAAVWAHSSLAPADNNLIHPIVAKQRENNKSSKESWDAFASHRQNVMDLVRDAANMARRRSVTIKEEEEGQQHVIFFGAGNCNDLDLPQLLQDFESIALVDIDNETVKEGVDRQLSTAANNNNNNNNDRRDVIISPSMDLSHTVAHTKDWAHVYHKSPPMHLYEATLKAVERPVMTDDLLHQVGAPISVRNQGGYDVAVSLCILSQFSSSLADVLDETSRKMDLVVLTLAVRRRHMEQMIQSLRPGGYGLMVVDMVSAATLPELLLVAAADNHDDQATVIEQLTEKAEQNGNFFHGTKRLAVVQALQREFENVVEHNVQLGPPWKWTLKGHKQYIVYSVLFRRKQ